MNSTRAFFKNRVDSEKFLSARFNIPKPKPDKKLESITKTLLKNVNHPKLSDLANWIDECFAQTYISCDIGFSPLNLIGSNVAPTNDGFKIKNSSSQLVQSKECLFYILRQNAILSTYESLRKFISYKNAMSTTSGYLAFLFPYGENNTATVTEKSRNREQYGLHYILNNNLSSLDEDGTIHLKVNNQKAMGTKRYLDSRINALAQEHKKVVSQLMENSNPAVIGLNLDTSPYKYPLLQLSTFELFQIIKGKEEPCINNEKGEEKTIHTRPKNIIAAHSPSFGLDRKKFLRYNKECEWLKTSLAIPGIDCSLDEHVDLLHPKMQYIDRLYCRFQMEKLLGTDLANCMYETLKDSPQELSPYSAAEVLSGCFLLPNVFSRNYIMQSLIALLDERIQNRLLYEEYVKVHPGYVFGLTDAEFEGMELTDSNNNENAETKTSPILTGSKIKEVLFRDFFQRKPEPLSENKASSIEEAIRQERANWSTQCKSFLHNLAERDIPIVDSYFFHMLWGSIRPYFSGGAKGDEKCATILFKWISTFLNSPSLLQNYFNGTKSEDSTVTSIFSALSKGYNEGAEPVSKPEKRSYIKRSFYEDYQACILANNIVKSVHANSEFLDKDRFFGENGTSFSLFSSHHLYKHQF